jgi:NAD(P)-dependent dehydrogenase (short-subunit alcohol dehydrogenase family)
MVMMTKGLAVELAPWKIGVNGIAPGAIATEPPSRPMPPAAVDAYRRRIPLGARGFPEDVAGVAAFLASDAARYITGQMLYVDGGYTIDGSLTDFKSSFHPVRFDDPDAQPNA